MKDLSFMICLSLFLCSCGGGSSERIQVNGMRSTVRSVLSGNKVELQNGTTVVLLGIKDSEMGKKYLEQHIKGKRVSVIADSRQPQYISSCLTTIYAYLRVESNSGCVQSKMLETRLTTVSQKLQCDSLQAFSKRVKGKEHPLMNSSELLTYMKPATFCIITQTGTGTGFFINDNGLALTNNHVYDGTESAVVCYFGEDGKLDASNLHPISRIIKTYSDKNKIDYTIFMVQLDNGAKSAYLPIIEQRANDGEQLAKLGCPVGEFGNFQTGVLSNYDNGYIIHSIGTNHGDSGGPIVNFRGEVVGINQSIGFNPSISEQAKGISYAVDALYIKNILDKMGIEYGR